MGYRWGPDDASMEPKNRDMGNTASNSSTTMRMRIAMEGMKMVTEISDETMMMKTSEWDQAHSPEESV